MNYAPTRAELLAMRQGLGAALSKYGDQLLTTRVGLWVGSHYLPDDLMRDLKAVLLAHGGQTVRIQELGVLDLYSAHRFATHRRPEYRRESDGKKDRVKEREMRYLVAAVLYNTGYSPRGTTWLTELGTAIIRDKLANWMADNISSAITVKHPGIIGRKQILGTGVGGGNPRHKAALEASHNLHHNVVAHLPGQTGHDRTEPERLHGDELEVRQSLKAINEIDPEKAQMLRLGLLEYWQAVNLIDRYDDLFVARRTDHEIEGWLECGHTVVEYRRDLLSDEWMSPQEFLALPPAQQETLVKYAETARGIMRVRKLSPLEAFQRGAGELVRVPDHIIALMFTDDDLGEDLRVTRRLTDRGIIKIESCEFFPDPLIYQGHIIDPSGQRHGLDDRRQYSVAVNPYNPDKLWVYNEDGAYIGAAPIRPRVSRLDSHAVEV